MSNTARKPSEQQPVNETEMRRLEQLLIMNKRLGDALSADIAALEHGAFGDLATTNPEIERLCALYGREVMALKAAGGIKNAPATLIGNLKESGAHLKNLLTRHEQLVQCMRQASEGLVKAIAEEVDRKRTEGAPYAGVPNAKRSASGSIVYNKVI